MVLCYFFFFLKPGELIFSKFSSASLLQILISHFSSLEILEIFLYKKFYCTFFFPYNMHIALVKNIVFDPSIPPFFFLISFIFPLGIYRRRLESGQGI